MRPRERSASDAVAVVAEFLARYAADRELETPRPVSDYVALFPEHGELIAREFEALERQRRAIPNETIIADDAADAIAGGGGAIRQLAQFRLIEEIARGAQAEVWRAEDLRLHRAVALKLFHGVGALSETELKRFRREAELAARIDHPNLCAVYESGVGEGVAWIAMRLVEGRSLADAIAKEPPSADRAEVLRTIELVERIARALHVAHEAGIVHRDVKPANVVLTAAGDPVLVDFGLACEPGAAASTRSLAVRGTPAYLAPEQMAIPAHRLDRRTDVWALGVTLFELLTGARPFGGPTREALYQSIARGELPDPRQLNAAIPRDLAVVLEKTLEKERERRYPTALAFADELRRVREQEPILARPISGPGRLLRWARRRPAAAGLALVLLLGIPAIGVLAGVILASRDALAAQRRKELEDDVERLLEQGFEESGHGSPALARVAFEEARRLDPENPEAAFGLAALALDGGDAGGALAFLDTVQVLAAKFPDLDLERARALDRLGRGDESRAVEKSVGSPRTPFGWFILGQIRMSEGHGGRDSSYVEAEENLYRAVLGSRIPRRLYYLELAHAVEHTKNAANARRVFDALTIRWPTSADAWDSAAIAVFCADREAALAASSRAIDLAPERITLLNTYGRLLGEAGRLDQAVEVLTKLVTTAPDYVRGHVTLGNVLHAAARHEAAEAEFRAALRLAPDDFTVLTGLGNALVDRGAIEEGIPHLERVVGLEPGLAAGFNNLGVAYRKAGRLADALPKLRRAVELAPTNALFRTNLGDALRESGAFDDAIRELETAVELNPDSVEAHDRLGVALMLRVPRERAALERALAEYDTALRIDGSYGNSLINRGTALNLLGRSDEAADSWKRGLVLLPECPEAASVYFNLARGAVRRGDASEALRLVDASIARIPNDADAHQLRGAILRSVGRFDDAVDALRRAIVLDEKNDRAYTELGICLARQGKIDDAIRAHASAVAAAPESAEPHYEFAAELLRLCVARRRPEVAASTAASTVASGGISQDPEFPRVIEEFREAIRCQPDHGAAHLGLGPLLTEAGLYRESLAILRRALELKSTMPFWNDAFQAGVEAAIEDAERMVPAEDAFERVLAGGDLPRPPAERAAIARVAGARRLNLLAARLYRDALAEDPSLGVADDQRARYTAACVALRVSRGIGTDDSALSDADRAAWRKQGLAWLQDALEQWRAWFDDGTVSSARMREVTATWRTDPDLAPCRGDAPIDATPASEQTQWRELWKAVAELEADAQE